MKTVNLNHIHPDSDGDWLSHHQRNIEFKSADNKIHVYFDNLEKKLAEYIHEADCVVGCVAWLTNKQILMALETKRLVSIIVQKEDFLRPDINEGGDSSFKLELQARYKKLKCELLRYEMPGLLSRLSTNGSGEFESIRCVGNFNHDNKPAFPRMHHKFVVFCKIRQRTQPHRYVELYPYLVWTGSFNFTENSVNSLENAVVIKDAKIAHAYYVEYAHIFALSESLDWTSHWVQPEYRIGT